MADKSHNPPPRQPQPQDACPELDPPAPSVGL